MTDGSPAVALRFEILGPVRAFRGAEPVDLGPPNQQAVLALLLLHAGEPVPVQRMVTALWGGDPPENGIDVVQRYLGALRRTLDPQRTSLIAFTPGGYVLRAGELAVDAEKFRAAVARARTAHQTGNIAEATGEIGLALDLWRDEPLTGLSGPVFDSARARLKAERATAAKLIPAPVPAPTPAPAPAPAPAPVASSPAYPDPVDPWAGHDLFPPDPF
jgi:DNA-binding winged helix-turn-helix (wHTH) protein